MRPRRTPAGQVTVEYVDLYEDRRNTEKSGIEQPGVVLLLCGDRRRALTPDQLYRYENKTRKEFTGEQAVTAAILDVSNPDRKKIYFLVGHAELRPDDVDPGHGLSMVRDQLRLRNYDVDTLDLVAAKKIPADASLLVSVKPVDPYTPYEQELLRQYLGAGAGRLILFLAPGTQPGLKDLLIDDWGVLVDDDVILDLASDSMTEDGDLIIRAYTPHPITQTLIDYKEGLRIGQARRVRPLPGRPEGTGLTVVTLAASSTTAWGEVDYRQRGIQTFTAGLDIKGLPRMDPPNRLGIAVSSERVPVRGGLPLQRAGRQDRRHRHRRHDLQRPHPEPGGGGALPRRRQLDGGPRHRAQRPGAPHRALLALAQRRRARAPALHPHAGASRDCGPAGDCRLLGPPKLKPRPRPVPTQCAPKSPSYCSS